jgi:hypothetical protein
VIKPILGLTTMHQWIVRTNLTLAAGCTVFISNDQYHMVPVSQNPGLSLSTWFATTNDKTMYIVHIS